MQHHSCLAQGSQEPSCGPTPLPRQPTPFTLICKSCDPDHPHRLPGCLQTSSIESDTCSTTAASPQVARSQVVGLPPLPHAPHTLLPWGDQQILNPAIQTIPTGSQDASRSPYEGLLSAAQQQTSLRPQDTEMWANPPTPLHPPGLALLPRRSNQ